MGVGGWQESIKRDKLPLAASVLAWFVSCSSRRASPSALLQQAAVLGLSCCVVCLFSDMNLTDKSDLGSKTVLESFHTL
jgi:hypothetical protein